MLHKYTLIVNLTIGSFMNIKDTGISKDRMLEIYKIIGQNVKRIRKEKNVSQLELSLAIGHKAVGTVSMCELGINNKHFNLEHLVKIADVLEIDINEFFKGIKLKWFVDIKELFDEVVNDTQNDTQN